MARISTRPASGRLKYASVAAMITSDARGTPAMPFDVISRISSIVTCCPIVSSMPYTWPMNSVAKVQYIIEPSRLNE